MLLGATPAPSGGIAAVGRTWKSHLWPTEGSFPSDSCLDARVLCRSARRADGHKPTRRLLPSAEERCPGPARRARPASWWGVSTEGISLRGFLGASSTAPPSPGAAEPRRAVGRCGAFRRSGRSRREGDASAVTEQKPREPRPFPPVPRPRGRSERGGDRSTPLVRGAAPAPSEPPGPQLAAAAHSPAGRGNPGKPRGLGEAAAAARPRPARPARAYRGRRPGHAESGAAGSGPAPGGCRSRGGAGAGAGAEGGG